MEPFFYSQSQLYRTIWIYIGVMIAATVLLIFRHYGVIAKFLMSIFPVLLFVVVLRCNESISREVKKNTTQFRADISKAVRSYFFHVFRSFWQTLVVLGEDCDDRTVTAQEKKVLVELEEEWKSEDRECEILCESPKEEGPQTTVTVPPTGGPYRRRARIAPPARQLRVL